MIPASLRRYWKIGASRVFSGIFLSRLLGLARERAIAHFFGAGFHADVWRVAMRLPNVLRNLLGEGTLAAAMVPVYSRLLEEGRDADARRFAGAVLGLLALVAGAVSITAAFLAQAIVEIVVPLWSPEKQRATATIVRIVTPMVGLTIVSAWAMAVLDSHRRFFVSYAGSSLWNLVMIVTLVAGGVRFGLGQDDLLLALGWGAFAGGALQLAIQGSVALRQLPGIRISLGKGIAEVREAVRNFFPVLGARGATNIGGWLELVMVGLLAEGAAAAMGYAQTLYLIPIALFGISIAAAELPELARMRAEEKETFVLRIERALGRLTRYTIPAVVGFLFLGDMVVATLFQTGAFGRTATTVTWLTLAAYALGIFASANSRTLTSSFYALREYRTPARIVLARVAISIAIGVALMFPLDRRFVGEPGAQLSLGPVGIALGTSVGAWIEWTMLRRALERRIGRCRVQPGRILSASTLALGCALVVLGIPTLAGVPVGALGAWLVGEGAGGETAALPPLAAGAVTLVPYCVLYLVADWFLGRRRDGPTSERGNGRAGEDLPSGAGDADEEPGP